MLIRSKFHDYYDTAATYGVDREVVYVRTPSVVRIPRVQELPYDYEFQSIVKRVGVLKTNVSYFLMGFCGKIYPGAKVTIYKSEVTGIRLLETHFIYSKKDLHDLVKLLNHDMKEYSRYSWHSQANQATFFEADYSKFLTIFHVQRAPSFLIHETVEDRKRVWQLVANPTLSAVRFQSVKDPHTAFQDIYQFISGVLGTTENRMFTLSDKELAKKRGHDGRYSFRTPPKGKK